MKKVLILCLSFSVYLSSLGQNQSKTSSIDFVAVVNNNHAETLYYYQNNWKVLREAALKKNYIDSYNLLEIEPTDATPYNFILITTYANQEQYNNREAHFEELINNAGGLKLLNDKKPEDFRTFIHGQDSVKNL